MISKDTIKDTVYELYKEAVIVLGEDVKKSLEDALKIEEHDLARLNIEAILKNIELAEEKVGDYIPPIDIELVDEDYLEITILPKGFGSENNNALKMALPAEGIEGVKEFVVESVLKAKGKPCPPTVIGVGIGGTSDLCLKLGKKALLGKVGERNPDPQLAKLEQEILDEINASGIGPMGLGGKTTTLDVKILKAHTHTAGLPVGVCVQCWADRHATGRIYDE